MKRNNIKRLISKNIKEKLEDFGAILIEGPKWSGKTWLGEQFSNSAYYMQELGIKNENLIDMPYNNPIFDGQKPKLIDEWQILPRVWDKVRFFIDKSNGESGLFILTGSTNLNKKEVIHSGAGRIARIRVNNLTFSEIIEDNKISLIDLFNQRKIEHFMTPYNIDWVARQLIKGGWPAVVANKSKSTNINNDYIESILNLELDKEKRVSKNTFRLILKSISRLNTSQIKKTTIENDLDNSVDVRTVDRYIDILSDLYIVDYIEPWNKNFRSKSAIRTTRKIYLSEPALGLSILNIKAPNDLYSDLNTFGIYFENQVIKDLSIYMNVLGGNIYFYRDNNNFEVDAIVELNKDNFGAIEIKIGEAEIDKAASMLLRFKEKCIIKPKFLLIITATHYSYQRKDGVYVIPHTCLGI